MAVQYDSENDSFKTWINRIKNDIPEASQEAQDTFKKLKQELEQNISSDNIDNWIQSNKLADESLIDFLRDAKYGTKDLDNYQQYLKDTSNTTISFSNIVKKTGPILKSFGASLASMAVNWALGEIIGIASTAIDNYVNRIKYANEAMDESISECASAKSGLEGINTELETQNKRIDELLTKDKLTYAEKGELEELQAITQELLLQQDIEERRVARASKDAANASAKAYDTQYGNVDKSHLQGLLDSIDAGGAFITPADDSDILGALTAYIRGTELLADAQKNYNQALKDGQDTRWAESSVQSYTDMVDAAKEILEKSIDDIREKRLAMEEEYNKAIEKRNTSGSSNLTSSEKDLIESYEKAADSLRMIYEYADKNAWNEIQLESIFNSNDIEKTKDELSEMAKAGTLTPEIIEGYKNLNNALQNTDLFLEEGQTAAEALCNQMYALNSSIDNEKIFKKVIGIRDGIISGASDQKIWNKVEDAFSDKNMELVLDAFINVRDQYGDHPEGWNVNDWISHIQTELDNRELELKSDPFNATSLTEVVSILDEMADKWKTVDSLYAEFLEKGTGNFNNEGMAALAESFKELGGIDIDGFLEVLSNSASTVDEVQDAFNRLSTEYIYASGCLNGLTEATAEQVSKELEAQGVANASEVIYRYLATAKEFCAATGRDLATATQDEIISFINEASASDTARSYIAQLELAKIAVNNAKIDTASDIDQIINLANAAGASASALGQLARAKAIYAKAESTGLSGSAGDLRQLEEADRIMDKISKGNFDYQFKIDSAQFKKPIYSGGSNSAKAREARENSGKSGSGSGGSSKSAKEETKEEIDWIERKNEILKKQHDINEKISNDSTQSYNERISAIDSLIAQDKERMEVAIQSAERYRQAWNEAIKNIDPLDISKIMTGAIDINEYSGDYADQLNEAMGLYDQMVDYEEQAADIQEESTNHIREQVKLREEIIKAQQDEINNEMDMIKSRMELVEAQGGVLNEGMYRQQIALSKELSSSYEDQIDNLHEQLDLVDEGSAEYYSILASINDCEKAIIDCKIQQEEWNEAIQRLPIERIQKYINELQNIKQDMENFLSERSTMGFSTTKPQYQQLIDISEEEIKKLLEQQGKLKDLLKNYSYGSEKFNDVSGEIQDIDNQISSLIQKQLEYNNAILQIPVEKAQQYIDSLDQVRSDLDNHINEQRASGKDIDINKYELLNMLANEKLKALRNQKDILTELLNVYDKDTDKYRDTVAQIQDVEDAMSSVVQEQHKWNEEILQIPIDKLSDVNDILSRYSDVLNSTLDDYDQALAGVNGLLDDQIDKLNDLKDASEEEYEARIEPLERQLELLQKTNEERKVQNALEQAEYDLDKAKNQKTTQVVRNGEVNYEADIDAIRDANTAKADAEYNKIVYDLETQIENLKTQRDELLKGYDDQIDRLDKIKDKWSEITDKIQLAIDMQKSEEVFGKGWDNAILSGNDNDLYEAFKKWYTDVSNEKNQADESIASNDRISEMMSLIVDKYRSGEMSYEQAIKEIASLSSAMKDGYTSIEQLEALMKMDSIKDVSGIVDASQKDILDTATLLSKYLGIVNKNEQFMNGYTSSWNDVNADVTGQINAIKSTAVSLSAMQSYFDAFQKNADAITKHTSTWEEMQISITEQIEALRKAAEALEKQMAEQRNYSSSHSYSSSSGGSKGSSSGSSGGGGSYVAAGPGFSESGMKDAIDRGDHIVFDGSGGGYSEKDIKDMYNDYVSNAQKRHKGAELGPIGKSSESQKDNLFQQFATKTLEPGEQLLIAQDKEWVLNQSQRDNILNAIGMNPVPMSNSMPVIPDFVKGNTMQDINVQFGDIVLPEVKRPDDFAKAIDNLFESSMRQNFSKVFK